MVDPVPYSPLCGTEQADHPLRLCLVLRPHTCFGLCGVCCALTLLDLCLTCFSSWTCWCRDSQTGFSNYSILTSYCQKVQYLDKKPSLSTKRPDKVNTKSLKPLEQVKTQYTTRWIKVLHGQNHKHKLTSKISQNYTNEWPQMFMFLQTEMNASTF